MRNLRLLARTALLAAVAAAAVTVLSASTDNGVMTRQTDGTYVVNTTTLGSKVRGFRGATPLKVYIKNDKVVKVEALANGETPQLFNKVKTSLLDRWNGMTAARAEKAQVDGATGATYSSKAVKENVRLAVAYYLKHK